MRDDMIGKTFGKWQVLKPANPPRSGHDDRWLCRCRGCGVVKSVSGGNMRSGKSKSCDACGSGRPRIEMAGRVFGLWRVIERASGRKWKCECLGCGTVHEVFGRSLRWKAQPSEGCNTCRNKIVRAIWTRAYYETVKDYAVRCGLPEYVPLTAILAWNATAVVGLPVGFKDIEKTGLTKSAAYLGLRYLWENGFVDRIGNEVPMTFQLSIRSLAILEKRANVEKTNAGI